MPLRAVIFDYGGVIVKDTHDLVLEDFARTCRTTPEKIEGVLMNVRTPLQKGHMDDDALKALLGRTFRVKIKGGMTALWTRRCLDRGFFEGNIALISVLKENGYRVGCISNTIAAYADFDAHSKAYPLFDALALSNRLGMRKPEPRIYLWAAKELGVPPGECAFIDDTESFVKAAEALGMKGITFTAEAKLKRDLRALGVKVEKR